MTELQTARLLLRDFLTTDWPSVHEYAGDEAVVELLEWGPNTEAQSKEFVRDSLSSQKQRPRTTYDLAVVHKTDQKLIGACGLVIIDQRNREGAIGYVFNRRYWGQGYATEAARRVIQFGIQELNLARITATCDADNVASRRVLEKSGMSFSQHLIGNREVKGRRRDTLFFELAAQS